jgi:hypothetical protein
LHHYLGLYVLARKFEIEVLQNDGKPHSCILLQSRNTHITFSHGYGTALLRRSRYDGASFSDRLHLCLHSRLQRHAHLPGVIGSIPGAVRSIEGGSSATLGLDTRALDQEQ